MGVRLLVFMACVAACALGHLAIVLSVARRPATAAEPGLPRPRRAVEIVWALLPALVLAGVLTATWERVRDQPSRPEVMMQVAR